MYQRSIQLDKFIDRKSIFLLGPRQTGKSTLLRQRYPSARYVDLLEADTFRELSMFPETLRGRLTEQDRLVIIDEVQKLPILLDEVQLLIDRNKDLRFILTGSSARKLRRGHANLLGGRAFFMNLHPLTSSELGYDRLMDRINWGSMPGIIDSPMPKHDLDAYVGTYLREEIQAESLTRSVENFSRVLNFASHFNARQINYTKVGNDAQVSPRTVKDYFQIFTDTLIARVLPPFQATRKRKAVATEKFYFFDLGVARNLARIGEISAGSTLFGDALEHLVFLELLAYHDYSLRDFEINYWRSQSQMEVDFVIGGEIAIEVKGTARVNSSDLKGIKALQEEIPLRKKMVVCMERERRVLDDVEILPLDLFFDLLWKNELF